MRSSFCRRVAAGLFCLAVTGCTAPPANGPAPAAAPKATAASPIVFEDVAGTAGLTWTRANGAFGKKWMPETMGGGGGFIDYDNDGDLDIILVNGDWWAGHTLMALRPTLALYRNNGQGVFDDVAAQVGLKVSLQGMGVAVGDYDGDGWDDLLITTVGGSRLFHNEAGKRFRDVSAVSGVAGNGWCTSAAWLDYDDDGLLDLFVCHYVKWSPETDQYCGGKTKIYCTPIYYPGDSCHLYRNLGGNKFRDVTREAGLWNDRAKALGVVTQDMDGDGKVDILVANDQETNFLYRNVGGKFKDISLESGLGLNADGHARAGMGIDVAEIRNDGAPAVIIGNFALEGVALHVRQPDGIFGDRSRDSGVLEPSYAYVTFGALWSDFDNDGFADALVTNGHVDDLVETTSPTLKYAQPNLVLANKRDGTFTDATTAAGSGVSQPMVGRGAARGDFDNDGRMDVLLVPNTGKPRLLRNTTPGASNWISLKLVGSKGNRNAYGARVTLETSEGTHTEWLRGGGSYLSQSDLRMHVGLGGAQKVEALEIHWPGGKVDNWKGVAANKRYRVAEGKAPEPLP